MDDKKYNTSFIAGPLMVITQKVTSLAFSIHDGFARNDSELTKSQRFYAVYQLPSPLEYFSYALAFPALMAGPVLFYKDYIDFIDGNNLIQKPASVCLLIQFYKSFSFYKHIFVHRKTWITTRTAELLCWNLPRV